MTSAVACRLVPAPDSTWRPVRLKGLSPDPQHKMKSNEGIGEMGGGSGCGMWKCVVNVGTERWEVKGGSVRE